mmetsp:Transcript_14773/g.33600  ORF Transcript_14773/g.33600 Transcript_14773/m.33600 type:complete len:477 (-) Transcript_14773:54-1484(-)
MIPDRVNLVYGNAYALMRASDDKPLVGVEVATLQVKNTWLKCNYRWILQRILGTNTYLIRNDNHPNKALVATDPVMLHRKNAEVILQRFFLETVKGGIDQDVFTFNIKTTSGKYMVISETVDRSGQHMAMLTSKVPSKTWTYSDAVRKASSIFNRQKAMGAVTQSMGAVTQLADTAASSAGSAARSAQSTLNAGAKTVGTGVDYGKSQLHWALKTPMRLMRRGDGDGSNEAEDFGVHLELYKGDASAAFAALAAKDQNNLSQVMPPLSTIFSDRMDLGTVPISSRSCEATIDDIFNILFGPSSRFMHEYQASQGCSDVVWSAPQVTPEAPFGGLGSLKCRLSVPVLGKRAYSETMRTAMCMEGGQKTLVCQLHGVIDGGLIGQIPSDAVYHFKEADGEPVLTMNVVIKTPESRAQQQAIDGSKKAMENFRTNAMKQLDAYRVSASASCDSGATELSALKPRGSSGCWSCVSFCLGS